VITVRRSGWVVRADHVQREVVPMGTGGRSQSGVSGESGSSGSGDRGGSTPDRSPNDDRSDAMNPTSDAYEADQENRSTQEERGG
jgi:hypothetical protein